MADPTAPGGHDIIVIGASAGGIEVLQRLLRDLPADLPAALCVVLHSGADSPGLLGQVIGRHCPLPVRTAADGMPLALGAVHVAAPDHHLLVEPGRLRVVRGPRENLHRPAIDPLFRSAAAAYGSRVIGVVLTGMLDDGTVGLAAIKSRGGVAVVQDPDEAVYPAMPLSALAHVAVDHCVASADMPALFVRLAGEARAAGQQPLRDRLRLEADMAKSEHDGAGELDRVGRRSTFTCPDCDGVLWELDEGGLLRYRCHVGHAYTADSLDGGQSLMRERALWVAVRVIEEQIALLHRLTRRAGDQPNLLLHARFSERAARLQHDADLLRALIHQDLAQPVAPAVPS